MSASPDAVGRRAFVLVVDACGVGALPDAADYGDDGANTLAHLAEAVGGLRLPALGALGLGSILALRGVAPAPSPAIHGRLHPLGPGKDSIDRPLGADGRRRSSAPPPTYPEAFRRRCWRGSWRRRHASDLQPPLQRDRGDRGLRRGAPAQRAR